jgi:surface polysaccharide O-acyltransferase-like enzyme
VGRYSPRQQHCLQSAPAWMLCGNGCSEFWVLTGQLEKCQAKLKFKLEPFWGIERKGTMKQRQTELDILRFLATLAVIMIHTGRNPYIASISDSTVMGRSIAPLVWCVPVFVMISGRFFLEPTRDISIGKLLTKYIPRLVFAFVIWSAVYTAYDVWDGTYSNLNIFGILTQYIAGPVHFWYLYMTVGLYLLTPILRKVAKDKMLCTYFLVIFAVYNFTTQYLIYLPKVGGIIGNSVGRFGMDLLAGYAGYFVLGYFFYENRERITTKWETVIYIVGVMLYVLTYVLDANIREELQNNNFVKQYEKPNVMLFSAAIYLFFVKRVSTFRFSEKVQKLFAKTTEYGFGVYILHALVISITTVIPLPAKLPLPGLVVILYVVIIFLCSAVLTALIRKIPIVGKHIL